MGGSGGVFTEYASGLHYRNAFGEWVESSLTPTPTAGGGVAYLELPVAYEFGPNANAETVVLSDRENAVGRSAVAGLSYYDIAGGASVVFATVKDAAVNIFNEGVYYEDAFDGVDADIVYRVHRWGVEQDVVLYGGLPPPSIYGLDPDATVLCVLTELVGLDLDALGVSREGDELPALPSSSPLRLFERAGSDWNLVYDWQRAYAFEGEDGAVDIGSEPTAATAAGSREPKRDAAEPIEMRVFEADGRLFLSEEVRVSEIAAGNHLLFAASAAEVFAKSHSNLAVPGPRPESGSSEPVLLADTQPLTTASPERPYVYRGYQPYVIDYIDYFGTVTTDITFESGATYYISSDLVLSGSNLIIEPGCYVKFAPGALIRLQNGATLETPAHHLEPALFTSAYDNDNNGEVIFLGDPALNKFAAALVLETSSNVIGGLEIRYAQLGVNFAGASGDQSLAHVQFLHCDRAVEILSGSQAVSILNGLIKDTDEGVWTQGNTLTVRASTFDTISNWALYTVGDPVSLTVQDTLFATVTQLFSSNVQTTTSFDHNAVYQSGGSAGADEIVLGSNPFLTGTYGNNYLDQTSPLIDAGSTTADALGLYHFTTATDHTKEAASSLDIGFHYADPADTDADGLRDMDEDQDGDGVWNSGPGETDWQDADTDDDGLSDGEEVAAGTDPTSPQTQTFLGTIWVDVGTNVLGAARVTIDFNATAIHIDEIKGAGAVAEAEFSVGESGGYSSGTAKAAYYQAADLGAPDGTCRLLYVYFTGVGSSGAATEVAISDVQVVDASTGQNNGAASAWIAGVPATLP